ncbi:betaine--homocysteine S-methyltransferase 1-like [Acanthaster planci]|uniref:Betaine--homocysteine S-methyltransferase 1-like n=1 Tax=Acanthaster planci TaxID=133434 RepID=A0A8B7XMU7_ACAPL|nr:betaine--homocysteine S-methyltransferase 1-like [Acanthaster planci]
MLYGHPSRMTKGLLERLAAGELIIGDGSFVFLLERRGYVSAAAWTPEACVLYPEAVRQLHREYLRAGADVMQTATFYSSDWQLQHVASFRNDEKMKNLTTGDINSAAVDLARGVAEEGGALVAGSVSPVSSIAFKKGKEHVINEFQKQMAIFKEKKVDFLLGEFFINIEEAEWAIQIMAEIGVPVACTMRIPPTGDASGCSPQECAVRMAKAGASVVGINCMYDPTICLETVALMKQGLKEAGLQTYLMVQPLGFHTQEPGYVDDKRGYNALPDWPYAMEPRAISRLDVHNYARAAYELGVRYIGGCCGFEPHHIRAIATELSDERGGLPPAAYNVTPWDALKVSNSSSYWVKTDKEYWDNLTPSTGRQLQTFATLQSKTDQ